MDRPKEFNTQYGEDLSKHIDKTFKKAITKTKKDIDSFSKETTSLLENTIKTLNSFTDAQGDITKGVKDNINVLEQQANALKHARSQLESYGSSLEDMGSGLSDSAEDVLTLLNKTIQRTDSLIKNSSALHEKVLSNSTRISERVQKGLKSNFVNSERLWRKYEKSSLSTSKKFYADKLEEEQRSMSDRIAWMEEYRNSHYSRLSDVEKRFFDTEFEEYKRRSEEIEDLIKVAGADISNSIGQQIKDILDNIRDVALVSAASDALSSGIDSFIENKHQLLTRTGKNFDFERYRDTVNNAPLRNNMMSRNEYSEVYSDIIKELRVQNMDEVEYFAKDVAAQTKAFGLSAGSLDRIFWADKNSGMQNQSYHKISNIAAALEDNENLYVDASKLLQSINDNIDNIAYLQYEDTGTYEKMYKSLATIEALSESSAMKGTEDLINAVKEMGSNQWDMLDSDFAKQFAVFSGAGSVQDLAAMVQDGRIDELLVSYQDYFKSMDDATLYSMVKSGKTPWSSFAEAKEFVNDDLRGYLNDINKSIGEGYVTNEDLVGEKGQEATTLGESIKNTLSGPLGRISDLFGELDINWINLAAKATVLSSIINSKDAFGEIFNKFAGSRIGQLLGNSAVVKGMKGFFTTGLSKLFPSLASKVTSVAAETAVTAATSAATSAATTAATSAAAAGTATAADAAATAAATAETATATTGLLASVGAIVGFVGTIAAGVMGAKYFSDKSKNEFIEEYRGKDLESGNTLSRPETDKGLYSAEEVVKAYDEALAAGEITGTDIGDSKTLGLLYQAGWLSLEDTDSNGLVDQINWTGLTYDASTMAIGKRSDGRYGVYDAIQGNFIDPTSGNFYDEKNPDGGYAMYDPNAGYAKGLSNVPKDGFAYLHEGEAVLTKDQAITARADGGIPQARHIGVKDFEEETSNSFFSTISLLKSIRDTLMESLGIDQKSYDADEKDRKKYTNGSSGGIFSGFSGGSGSPLSRLSSAVSSTVASAVDTAKALLLGEDNSKVARTDNKNTSQGTADDFRYQDLGSWSVPNVNDMNDWIASVAPSDSPFIGNAQAFLDAAAKTGLDPRYLVAHAGLESRWGTDYKAANSNNYFGYGAFDNNVKNMYKYSYDTFEEGIEGIAEKIANGYYNKGQKSLYQMRWNNGNHQYATAQNWDSAIADILSTAPENTDFRTIFDPEPSSNSSISYLNKALDYLGYKETGDNGTMFGEWIGSNGNPWCASFVSWALDQAGINNIKSARVSGIMEQAIAQGIFHQKGDGYTPKPGDIFINKGADSSHTGFVLSVNDDGTFTTVEGNSGDMVASNTRSFDSLELTGFVSMNAAEDALNNANVTSNSLEDTSKLSTYAEGTPWLPTDQVAVIHQGEMIVPADSNPFNSPVTGMMSSDNSDVVEIVRWMVNIMSSKFDAILGTMNKGATRATPVPFNSDMAYVYSR